MIICSVDGHLLRKNWLEVGALASPLERLFGPTAPSCPRKECGMSKQTKPSIVFAHGADGSSFSNVGDAKGQMPLQTSAEFVRTYNAQAHEVANAITAV